MSKSIHSIPINPEHISTILTRMFPNVIINAGKEPADEPRQPRKTTVGVKPSRDEVTTPTMPCPPQMRGNNNRLRVIMQ